MSARTFPPVNYNLLELYRQHRHEIDAISDPATLFILAYVNRVGRIQFDEIAGELGVSLKTLNTKLLPLFRGELITESAQTLFLTPLGKQVLDELGFGIPLVPPSEPPKQPKPPKPTPTAGDSGWLLFLQAFLVTGLLVLIAAVAGIIWVLPQFTATPVPPPPRPGISIVFSADREKIVAGECTVLRWNVQNAEWVELDGRRVNANDTMQVCPSQTQTFHLIVGGGPGANVPVTINVIPQLPDIKPTPVDAEISFIADQYGIKQGECTVLRWQVIGGLAVQLDGQPVGRIESRPVCPPQTTTYVISVDLGATIKRRELTINVNVPPPPIMATFTPTPSRTWTPTPTWTPSPAVNFLFFDDFNISNINSLYQADLPNAPFKYGLDDAKYLGASNFQYQSIDNAQVLRMRNILQNTQRKGWSTRQTFSIPEGRVMRLEARFNTLRQSPDTGIDQLIELWLLDARGIVNCSTSPVAQIPCWRYDKGTLLGMNYGKERRFSADTLFSKVGVEAPFAFTDNTWYRIVISGSSARQVRVSIFADDGKTELIGTDLGHALNIYPTGFRIGFSQSTGFPNGSYPTDVAIDWIRLSME